MADRECPMCGEQMRIKESAITDRVPGTPQTRTTQIREWVCPECDYFEEEDQDN